MMKVAVSTRLVNSRLVRGLAVALIVCAAAPARADLAPLSDDQAKTLREAPDEPLEVSLEMTWPRTNEWRLDTLFGDIAGIGGGYVGVGADQNYTLAGIAKSEYLWLIDHDPQVRDIHLMYGALIEKAETPDDFLAFFAKDGRDKAKEILGAAIPDEKRAKKVIERFTKLAISKKHQRYFASQRTRQFDGKPVTWLGDPAVYAHVRNLFLAKRVHAVAADLGGTKAMAAIAKSAETLGAVIRIVYVSNAESFFEITDQVRTNYTGLPHDEKSVLIRTVMMGLPKAKTSVWHYQTQEYDDFVAKLAKKKEYPSYREMVMDLKTPEGEKFIDASGHSKITKDLPPRKRAKKKGAD
jgi:hypothetical protein